MIDIENQIAISERSSGWATITTVKPTQIRCPDLVNQSDKNLVFLGNGWNQGTIIFLQCIALQCIVSKFRTWHEKKWQKVTMLQYNIRMANLSHLVLVIPKWKGLLVNEGFCWMLLLEGRSELDKHCSSQYLFFYLDLFLILILFVKLKKNINK